MVRGISRIKRLAKSGRKTLSHGALRIKFLARTQPVYLAVALTSTAILVFGSVGIALRAWVINGPAAEKTGTTVTEKTGADSKKNAANDDCDDPSQNSGGAGSVPKSGSSSTPKSSGGGAQQDSGEPAPSTPAPTPAPAPPPETLTATVAFYSDSQSDTDAEDANHQRVVNYITATSASTIFHAGDLMEDGTQDSLNRFNAVTSAMCSSRGFYAAQGNNERNSPLFFDNFQFPGNEHWYSVNVGNLHMVVLDTYASSVAVGSEQYNWLAADLQSAASQSRSTGVIFHYPVYGAGGDYKGLINTFVPLFKSYGVDFVVSGHEHAYQKSYVDSIYYFVASGQPAIGYMLAKIYSTNRVVLTAYDSGNNVIETVNIPAR